MEIANQAIALVNIEIITYVYFKKRQVYLFIRSSDRPSVISYRKSCINLNKIEYNIMTKQCNSNMTCLVQFCQAM